MTGLGGRTGSGGAIVINEKFSMSVVEISNQDEQNKDKARLAFLDESLN